MTPPALKYNVITYTPYEGLNYIILDKINHCENVSVDHLKFKYDVTGANQVNSVTRAHNTIYCDWIKPFDACVTRISICFIFAGIIVLL